MEAGLNAEDALVGEAPAFQLNAEAGETVRMAPPGAKDEGVEGIGKFAAGSENAGLLAEEKPVGRTFATGEGDEACTGE